MPLHVGWNLVIWVLLIGITQEHRIKPSDPDLYQGASTPVWSYGEVLAHDGSHPRMMTQTPLKS
jgi:hypothetical protein